MIYIVPSDPLPAHEVEAVVREGLARSLERERDNAIRQAKAYADAGDPDLAMRWLNDSAVWDDAANLVRKRPQQKQP